LDLDPPQPTRNARSARTVTVARNLVTLRVILNCRSSLSHSHHRGCAGRAWLPTARRRRQRSRARTQGSQGAVRGGPVSQCEVPPSHLSTRAFLRLSALLDFLFVDSPCAPSQSTDHDQRAHQDDKACRGPQPGGCVERAFALQDRDLRLEVRRTEDLVLTKLAGDDALDRLVDSRVCREE